jgi:hypothetical protein
VSEPERPGSVRRLLDGAESLVPGVYLRPGGGLVFNLAEVLAHVGLDDTPENRALGAEVVREIAREAGCPVGLLRPDPFDDLRPLLARYYAARPRSGERLWAGPDEEAG